MDHLSEVVDSRLKILLSDYYEFEQLLKKLPADMKEEMNNSVKALESALNVAPEHFEQHFGEIMKQAIEVATNIEQHTKEFNESMKSYHSSLSEHAEATSKSYQKELQVMKSEHEQAIRAFTSEQAERIEEAQQDATERGNRAVKKAETACNKLIKKFEDHCVVPLPWLIALPLGGGIVGAVVTLVLLTVAQFVQKHV
ncbi:hypothetical protein ACWXOO_004180 [Vibrio parahaemolyticus]